MDHSTIITINFRNMVTIVAIVLVGWFILHLIGNAGLNASTRLAGNVGPANAEYNTGFEIGV